MDRDTCITLLKRRKRWCRGTEGRNRGRKEGAIVQRGYEYEQVQEGMGCLRTERGQEQAGQRGGGKGRCWWMKGGESRWMKGQRKGRC